MIAPAPVRLALPTDARAIARLHREEISEGFLALLGEGFLRRLYRRVAITDGSFVFVTTHADGTVTGFVAVAESTGRLYRAFLVRDGLAASLGALGGLARHPRQVLETLRHGLGGSGTPESAEILALAVSPGARGHGLGRRLVTEATSELRRRGVATAHVVTAATNDPAQRTYRACGFEGHTTVELHRGTVQEVLVWR